MIQAHEIQGVLALNHSFNRVGLDHVLLVRIASTAVATRLLRRQSRRNRQRRLERVARRRRAANLPARAEHGLAQELGRRRRDEPRRSACALGTRGRDGLSVGADRQGLGLSGRAVQGQARSRSSAASASYVMENVLFKISFPAEFHAQTAVEAALKLHPLVAPRIADIARITIETQEPGVRIIDKTGPLANPADRDHCLQYMVAVPLLFGRLTADDYEDDVARDPRIDALRAKMVVSGEREFQPRLPRPRQARDRQRRAGVVRGRLAHRARGRRLSDRASASARGGHPAARGEVRAQPRDAFTARAMRARSRRRVPSRRVRGAARRGVHGVVGAAVMSQGKKFRRLVAKQRPLQIPGAVNAYCALLAQRAGFKALYLSGAGVANASFGLPDLRANHARRRARGRAAHHGGDGSAVARRRRHRVRQRVQHRAHGARDGARRRRRDPHRGSRAGEALRPSAEQSHGRRRGDVRSAQSGRRRTPRRRLRDHGAHGRVRSRGPRGGAGARRGLRRCGRRHAFRRGALHARRLRGVHASDRRARARESHGVRPDSVLHGRGVEDGGRRSSCCTRCRRFAR